MEKEEGNLLFQLPYARKNNRWRYVGVLWEIHCYWFYRLLSSCFFAVSKKLSYIRKRFLCLTCTLAKRDSVHTNPWHHHHCVVDLIATQLLLQRLISKLNQNYTIHKYTIRFKEFCFLYQRLNNRQFF